MQPRKHEAHAEARRRILVIFVSAFVFSGAVQADDAVERGKQTFMRVGCYQCHGREAQGASTGPRLGPNPLPLAAFTRAVRTPRNEMPPYTARVLSDAEIADVYAFVSARPRPHELPK
jgi:ubiquinol-cytochrome c reductase cytochrome c subunit